MGKTLLTPKQLDFLELAQAQAPIAKNYYLTGGSALSEFYLKHRLSEDLDLFSEKEVEPRAVEAFIKGAARKLGIAKAVSQHFLGLYTYKLEYDDGETLKVDFNFYPFPRIEKGVYFKNLEVSSVYDIAVNKIHTIGMKPRARDYVDLYFIFKKGKQKPEQLMERMRIDSQAKFDWPLESKNLAVSFTRVKDISNEELPKILIPFNRRSMEQFFLRMAKGLEDEIFK